MFLKKDLSRRVWILDEARGLFILLMVLYHLGYDLAYIFRTGFSVMDWPIVQYLQLLIAGLFIFISGIACRFSRNNWKRGLQCFAFGMAMTLITMLVLPQQRVLFGVLHFLGVSMMLFALFAPQLDRLPPLMGLVLCAALFFITFNVQSGYLGMGHWKIALPDALYHFSFLFPIGFPQPSFWSSDYFPLLPWVFWFFGGVYAGVAVKERRCPAWFYLPHSRLLAFLGRNTIWIYLLHQPVLYGLLLFYFHFSAV